MSVLRSMEKIFKKIDISQNCKLLNRYRCTFASQLMDDNVSLRTEKADIALINSLTKD